MGGREGRSGRRRVRVAVVCENLERRDENGERGRDQREKVRNCEEDQKMKGEGGKEGEGCVEQ